MKRPGRAALIRATIVGVWLVLVGLFLRFEVFPEYFARTLPGYRSLLSGDVLVEDTWSRIVYGGQAIGYTHTSIDTDDANPLKHRTILSRVYVRLRAMGFDQPIYVDTTVELDVTDALQTFVFELSSRGYNLSIRGVRTGGERFAVTMKTGTSTQRRVVDLPDDVILYSPMTELALKRLRPGGELSFRSFDPATLTPARVHVRALREEPFSRGGTTVPAVVLATDYQGMTVHSWISRDGTLLRQETPLGWTLESCTADEAMGALRRGGDGPDMIADLAVRLTGTIRDPAGCRLLRLRLTGPELAAESLRSPRQRVESVDANGVTLVVTRGTWPAGDAPSDLPAGERAAALAATPFIQSDDPDIRATAADIVKGLSDPRARAEAICAWVHGNVRKEMTVSLPSAVDVLKTLAGDCNEHTYLFVALARAAGLPARVMVGLACHEQAFYYHAWPAVHVGEWVEVDPTWGQAPVDATHLRLLEGELEKQVDLIRFVGRLQIEVLEER